MSFGGIAKTSKNAYIVFLRIAATLVLAVVCSLGLFRPALSEPGTLPETMEGDMTFVHESSAAVGTWNVPFCQKENWTLTMRNVVMQLKKSDTNTADYEVISGSWSAEGGCTGNKEETFDKKKCRWTYKDEQTGTGSFPGKSPMSMTVTYMRKQKVAILGFAVGPVKKKTAWEYTCMGSNKRLTGSVPFLGGIGGYVEERNGQPTFVMNGTATGSNSLIGGRWKSTCTGKLEPGGLKAVPGNQYSAVRGSSLKLDGSKSRGSIKQYEWEFSPACDSRTGGTKSKKKGKIVSVLCDTDVTLTVSDGKRKDTARTRITVKPRRWETAFTHNKEALWFVEPFIISPLHIHSGSNACNCGAAVSGHVIHRSDNNDWTELYDLEKIKDTQGPFDGWWYVSRLKLKAERNSWLNTEFQPGSKTYKENVRFGSKEVFDTMLTKAEVHERLHSTIAEELLRKKDFDPAPRVEPFIEKDRQGLKEKVENVLRSSEAELVDAINDEKEVKRRLKLQKRFNRKGEVRIHASGKPDTYETFMISNLAEMSD